MIKGARQVGKTYLIREFGHNEYESFIEINFIVQKELKFIFAGDLSADNIYKRMSISIPDIHLIPGKTLIFLDEIQNCGNARTALKFLTEDGRFDVITSGSLLGLTYAENGDTESEEPECRGCRTKIGATALFMPKTQKPHFEKCGFCCKIYLCD